MSWAVGYDEKWQRDIGYGVPAICDHPRCHGKIDRGLAYVCGGEAYGGERGCGLYFCCPHLNDSLCPRCQQGKPPFKPKPDTPEWISHKATDPIWAEWREEQAAKKQAGFRGLPSDERAGTNLPRPKSAPSAEPDSVKKVRKR